ncbi:MAG: hypothetical protein HZB76_04870 [Chlamydiae bacterium]|nr:hypothetical protein [Chlamydiota bacterium]
MAAVGRGSLPFYYEILTPPTIEYLRERWNVESYESQIDDYLYLAKEAKNSGNLPLAKDITKELFDTLKNRFENTPHYPRALLEFIDKYCDASLHSDEFDLVAIFSEAYKLASKLEEIVNGNPEKTLSNLCFKEIVLKAVLSSAKKLKVTNPNLENETALKINSLELALSPFRI